MRLDELSTAVVQDKGCREEVGQRYGPGGGASSPAGSQLMGLSVEDRQEVGGVAVMLRADPQLCMGARGAETEESWGEAAPQKLQDGEFRGEAHPGAQQD